MAHSIPHKEVVNSPTQGSRKLLSQPQAHEVFVTCVSTGLAMRTSQIQSPPSRVAKPGLPKEGWAGGRPRQDIPLGSPKKENP